LSFTSSSALHMTDEPDDLGFTMTVNEQGPPCSNALENDDLILMLLLSGISCPSGMIGTGPSSQYVSSSGFLQTGHGLSAGDANAIFTSAIRKVTFYLLA
jgi:hypothetical protein